ncbi:nucleic acid/nucleotide deaminase domain-containing protein [Streptomyces sp. NPDC057684]|uniref:nucleic acid/nucleotide deaminase domain-containing protein n=1 Tax=unclassified Streptomyces TaxID=2593676 RepID=UPI0035E1E29B
MGYTIPGWLDDVLDFIGINFPNVDEDDYREMADAMREFAEKFEGHGGDAHKAFSRILSSSEGWAVDAMEKHWNQIKASHLEKLPDLARLFADACDALADIIFGMKTKAEIELGVMAASVGISAGLAIVTGGLSALIGAAEVTAMRQVVKRLIDEAADRIVDEVIAKITAPINAKLEAMIEDMILDLAEGAFHMPADGSSGGGHGGKSGHGGMQLASAGGPEGSSGSNKRTRIDHVEFEDGAGKVSGHGTHLKLTSTHLSKARTAFGRSKGRDPWTNLFDPVLHGALKGADKALVKIGHHIEESVPKRVKGASALHKGNDIDIRNRVEQIKSDTPKSDGPKSNVPMYLLNTSGAVDRLHPDGSRTRVTGKESDLPDIVGGDGKVWRYRSTDKGSNPYPVDTKKEDNAVDSRRLDPHETHPLAEATQLARYAKGDYTNGNYAAVHYTDSNGNPFILVGHSQGVHSERTIGYPVLRDGNPAGVGDLYTEREPCQAASSWCDKWLGEHFRPDMDVTHSHSYDQSLDENGKQDPKKDAEHTKFKDNLKEWHRQHGLGAGMMTESDGAAMEAARKRK